MAWNNKKVVQALSQSAVPIGIPPSGNIGNNGALNGLANAPSTYSAGAYLYFGAGVIGAGVPAGLYWTVMSGLNAGTIYNNTYNGGDPVAPASLVPFATTGPGAYTQSTSEITLRQTTVAGGLMGRNGALRDFVMWNVTNSAGTKTLRAKLGGVQIDTQAATTTVAVTGSHVLQNRNSESSQIRIAGGGGVSSGLALGGGTSGTLNETFSVNTAASTVYSLTGQLASASDWLISEAFLLEVIPG